jgi:phosphinothricin acetyltransferase
MLPQDGASVVDIFNHYVENSFAAYAERKVSYEFFDMLLTVSHGYPAICAKDERGQVIGFGLLREHHALSTFSQVAESTYFISPEYTGKGIGTSMLEYLVRGAKKKDITSILASISSLNKRSISFHKKNGFKECGRFRNICKKKGKLFDVVWMQRVL